MSAPIDNLVYLPQEVDMARRRGQRTGYLRRQGPSWLLTWREDARDDAGTLQRVKRTAVIAPALGPDAVSKREAERLAEAQLNHADRAGRHPSSLMSLADFWATKFATQVIWKLKPSGQKHYAYMWRKLEPLIGKKRLCDIGVDDVEYVMSAAHRKGFSAQTLLHLKNALSAVIRHAKKLRLYNDDNPAALVEAPEILARRRPVLTPDQARRAVGALKSPYREMAITSIATSMGPAELCGITLQGCNLTGDTTVVDGEVLAPYCVAVRENYYEGKRGSLKASSRSRIVPLTPAIAKMLADLVAGSKRQDADAPLFQSRRGTPIDAHNVSNRHFGPLSRTLGFPVTWYSFRRAHSAMAGQAEGVSVEDRKATMGHADVRMTLYYSVSDIERRRRIPEAVMEQLMGVSEGPVQ